MADNDFQVIIKAKELAVHSFKLTSNCNRYPKNIVILSLIKSKSKALKFMKHCLKQTE